MTDRTAEATLPRTVAVSGSTGLIGDALVRSLQAQGRTVRPLVRREGGPGEISWDPEREHVDTAAMEGIDALVHLAGEPVGERWTDRKKRRIRESRVKGTHTVAEAVSRLHRPPSVLVCASAIGYFGDRGDEVLDDDAGPGDGFLAEVAREWEAAAAPAERAGVRVVHLRFGVVLARQGGALARMLTPFRLGVGGRLGSGRQWMSWISLDDVVGAIEFALDHPRLRGSVNAVAPEPVTNADFTRTLAAALGRKPFLPVPSAALRLAFGEMAEGTLLASQRAVPGRLTEAGYTFRHPRLPEALRAALAPAG